MLVRQCVRRLALLVLLGAAAPLWAAADDARWGGGLRAEYFQDREITVSKEVIALEAPYRAEDAAIVPLRIRAGIEQTEGRYIKTVTLLIDNNPEPLVGRFHFTPRSGRADLALRVRVNAYSPVRVIAETSDGELHMDEAYVKASGGCSAPVGTDLEAAMKRLGRMKFRVKGPDLEQPLQTQLGVSHPNITGMQMDQLTRMYAPAHYVTRVKVSFEGEPIFWAETDISVSENPNFRFFFIPGHAGELLAEVTDNKGETYSERFRVPVTN